MPTKAIVEVFDNDTAICYTVDDNGNVGTVPSHAGPKEWVLESAYDWFGYYNVTIKQKG